MLMPIVNATKSSSRLALSQRIIRESVKSHPPNLEMLQEWRIPYACLTSKTEENNGYQCA
jgi:hypothetical protein